MTRQTNSQKWVAGVSDFKHTMKNLKLAIELDNITDLYHEWHNIRSRLAPYEFLWIKYDIPKLILKRSNV